MILFAFYMLHLYILYFWVIIFLSCSVFTMSCCFIVQWHGYCQSIQRHPRARSNSALVLANSACKSAMVVALF